MSIFRPALRYSMTVRPPVLPQRRLVAAGTSTLNSTRNAVPGNRTVGGVIFIGQEPPTSTMASAKACGASCGRLCPTPPEMVRCAYSPENFAA